MKNGKEREIKGIYAAVLMVFLVFLLIPILLLLGKSFEGSSGFTLARYGEILTGKDFPEVLGRSIWGCVHQRGGHNDSGLFSGLHHSLYESSGDMEKGYSTGGCGADAAAYDYIWICHYLFVWKTGAFNQNTGISAF